MNSLDVKLKVCSGPTTRERSLLQAGATLGSLPTPRTPLNNVTQPKQNTERGIFLVPPKVTFSLRDSWHIYAGKCDFLGWTLNATTTLQCHQQAQSFLAGNIKPLWARLFSSFSTPSDRLGLVHNVLSFFKIVQLL